MNECRTFTSKIQLAARLKLCGRCDKILKPTWNCAVCGCFVKIKARVVIFYCPLLKWDMPREIFENYYEIMIADNQELMAEHPLPDGLQWLEINETIRRCINPENSKKTPREIYDEVRVFLKYNTQPVSDVVWEVVQQSMFKYAKRMKKILKSEGFLLGGIGDDLKIGQKVLFLGRTDFEMMKEIASYRPLETIICAINDHISRTYIIEHPDGKPKANFVGFEGVAEELLDDNKRYLSVVPDSLILSLDL